MICGNDPTANLDKEDKEWIDWFRNWLRWSYDMNGPEPVAPDGSKPWEERRDS